ncbi:hypothetical protein TWF128_011766 [Orbilia oligospora]|nr:hypothetical protein TWF128_011766 [Orbilia oligospora]
MNRISRESRGDYEFPLRERGTLRYNPQADRGCHNRQLQMQEQGWRLCLETDRGRTEIAEGCEVLYVDDENRVFSD